MASRPESQATVLPKQAGMVGPVRSVKDSSKDSSGLPAVAAADCLSAKPMAGPSLGDVLAMGTQGASGVETAAAAIDPSTEKAVIMTDAAVAPQSEAKKVPVPVATKKGAALEPCLFSLTAPTVPSLSSTMTPIPPALSPCTLDQPAPASSNIISHDTHSHAVQGLQSPPIDPCGNASDPAQNMSSLPLSATTNPAPDGTVSPFLLPDPEHLQTSSSEAMRLEAKACSVQTPVARPGHCHLAGLPKPLSSLTYVSPFSLPSADAPDECAAAVQNQSRVPWKLSSEQTPLSEGKSPSHAHTSALTLPSTAICKTLPGKQLLQASGSLPTIYEEPPSPTVASGILQRHPLAPLAGKQGSADSAFVSAPAGAAFGSQPCGLSRQSDESAHPSAPQPFSHHPQQAVGLPRAVSTERKLSHSGCTSLVSADQRPPGLPESPFAARADLAGEAEVMPAACPCPKHVSMAPLVLPELTSIAKPDVNPSHPPRPPGRPVKHELLGKNPRGSQLGDSRSRQASDCASTQPHITSKSRDPGPHRRQVRAVHPQRKPSRDFGEALLVSNDHLKPSVARKPINKSSSQAELSSSGAAPRAPLSRSLSSKQSTSSSLPQTSSELPRNDRKPAAPPVESGPGKDGVAAGTGPLPPPPPPPQREVGAQPVALPPPPPNPSAVQRAARLLPCGSLTPTHSAPGSREAARQNEALPSPPPNPPRRPQLKRKAPAPSTGSLPAVVGAGIDPEAGALQARALGVAQAPAAKRHKMGAAAAAQKKDGARCAQRPIVTGVMLSFQLLEASSHESLMLA